MLIKTWAAPFWRICVRRRGATGTTLAAPIWRIGNPGHSWVRVNEVGAQTDVPGQRQWRGWWLGREGPWSG